MPHRSATLIRPARASGSRRWPGPQHEPDIAHRRLHAAVFGASGGIGRAFVEQLTVDPRCARVHAGARNSPAQDHPKVDPFHFDLTDPASLEAAAQTIGAPDLVIVATGILHGDNLAPEKSMRALDPAQMNLAFAINAAGPALIARLLLPRHAAQPAQHLRRALRARRVDLRQPARRLAQLSRLEGRPQHADPLPRHRTGAQPSAVRLRRAAPGHGGYRSVEAVPVRRHAGQAVLAGAVRPAICSTCSTRLPLPTQGDCSPGTGRKSAP